jgi:hypothetical protein
MHIGDKYKSAVEYYGKGNLSQAESILNEIVHFQVHHRDALFLLAEISYRMGNYFDALINLKKTIQYGLKNAEV